MPARPEHRSRPHEPPASGSGRRSGGCAPSTKRKQRVEQRNPRERFCAPPSGELLWFLRLLPSVALPQGAKRRNDLGLGGSGLGSLLRGIATRGIDADDNAATSHSPRRADAGAGAAPVSRSEASPKNREPSPELHSRCARFTAVHRANRAKREKSQTWLLLFLGENSRAPMRVRGGTRGAL